MMVRAILNLSELPPPDAADALAVAICHIHFKKADPI
jgi:Holliday junction resolvasome RuvABC endonuclease subunit